MTQSHRPSDPQRQSSAGLPPPAGTTAGHLAAGIHSRRALHRQVLTTVARALAPLPSVLKGGSALNIAYGRNRHTEDLDYNAERALSLDAKITAALTDIGGTVHSIQLTKDTATVRRAIVSYSCGDAVIMRFKVETSLRDRIDPATVVMRQGVRTYTISTLASQKLQAMNAEDGRTVPRDLEDIRFIADVFDADLAQGVRRAIADLVLDGGERLLVRYRAAYAFSEGYTEEGLTQTLLDLLAYAERSGHG